MRLLRANPFWTSDSVIRTTATHLHTCYTDARFRRYFLTDQRRLNQPARNYFPTQSKLTGAFRIRSKCLRLFRAVPSLSESMWVHRIGSCRRSNGIFWCSGRICGVAHLHFLVGVDNRVCGRWATSIIPSHGSPLFKHLIDYLIVPNIFFPPFSFFCQSNFQFYFIFTLYTLFWTI